jgi:4-amino-4-deoxy-L-arabinose transferase-like glycosyltransferase
MRPRVHYILLVVLLATGFLMRIDVAFRNPVAGGDEREYVGMAFSLLFKGRLENVEFPASLRSFFYPVYLAAFLWVSRPVVSRVPIEVPSVIFNAPAYLLKWILVSRFFNVLISTMVIYITYLIGRRLFNRKVGLLAALLGVLNPTSVAVAGTALAENSQALFVATSFLFLLQSRFLLAAGILMGFGYLCRFQTALYLIPIILFLREDRTSLRDFLVGFILAALLIGGLFDYLAYGGFFVSPIKTLQWALVTRQPGHKTVPVELLWIQVAFVFGPAIYLALENIRKDLRIISLWSPILVNLVFFTFIRAKDPRYICDLIPFLSVLCADGAFSKRRRWHVLVFLLWSFFWCLVLWIYSPEIDLV